MAIRKGYDEELVVDGDKVEWLKKCETSLINAKFKKVHRNDTLGQVTGNYKPIVGTLSGEITVTVIQEGKSVRLKIHALANVDNVYALLKSPGARLIEKLKEGLS